MGITAIAKERLFMKLVALVITIIILTNNHYAWAGLSKKMTIRGVIVEINKKQVTLFQRGQKVKVPKNSIPKSSIKMGREVTAVMDSQPILNAIRKKQKKKKSK